MRPSVWTPKTRTYFFVQLQSPVHGLPLEHTFSCYYPSTISGAVLTYGSTEMDAVVDFAGDRGDQES